MCDFVYSACTLEFFMHCALHVFYEAKKEDY